MSVSTKLLATKSDITNFKYELLQEITDTKRAIIKWMFIFWIGQFGGTAALIMLLLKK